MHLSSAYSACCRVLYSLKAVTPELTTAAEGPFVPLKLRAKVTGLRTGSGALRPLGPKGLRRLSPIRGRSRAQWRQELAADLTKFGFLVYGGTVRDFHEWEFRAMVRFNKTKDEDKPALASKFLDSLRTDAYVIAEDLGPEILG